MVCIHFRCTQCNCCHNMAANVETELDIIHDTDENWEFIKIFIQKITESIFISKKYLHLLR